MSVLQLRLTDAQPDEKLDLHHEKDWSRMRSGHAGREVLAYNVKSDSGNTYEVEVFISELLTLCAFCSCPARVVCRHAKAVLYDVLKQTPDFGKEAKCQSQE